MAKEVGRWKLDLIIEDEERKLEVVVAMVEEEVPYLEEVEVGAGGGEVKGGGVDLGVTNSLLASKAKGGLGIRSLKLINHALIQKWHWRFLKTPIALWVMTIKAIYGLSEDSFISKCLVKGNGVWARIVKDINAPVNDQGLISDQLIKRNVCDSRTTRLWKDFWIGDTPLQHQFPCLFRLEVNQDCMVRVRWNDGRNWIWSRPISCGNTSTQLSTLNTLLDPIILSEARDEWVWLLDPSSEFS
nr:RNA-directed DNA polymerase, eukaryota [Tanacetum cinerariifolium]